MPLNRHIVCASRTHAVQSSKLTPLMLEIASLLPQAVVLGISSWHQLATNTIIVQNQNTAKQAIFPACDGGALWVRWWSKS